MKWFPWTVVNDLITKVHSIKITSKSMYYFAMSLAWGTYLVVFVLIERNSQISVNIFANLGRSGTDSCAQLSGVVPVVQWHTAPSP